MQKQIVGKFYDFQQQSQYSNIFNLSRMSLPGISENTNKKTNIQYQQIKNKHLKRFKLDYEYPARLSVAYHQQNASKIQAYTDSSESAEERCSCCDLPCQTHQISVCEQLFQWGQNKSKINIGRYTDNNVSILFHILKATALFYFLRSILVQILRWALLNQTKYCADNQFFCRLQTLNQFIALPSLLYTNSELLQMEVFITAIVLLISILFFGIYRYFLFKHYDLVSAKQYYEDQYSVFVENVSFVSVLQAEIGQEAVNASLKVREKKEHYLQESFVDRAALRQTNNPQALIKSSLQLHFMSLVRKIKKRLEKKVDSGEKLSQVEFRLHNRLITLNQEDLKENIVRDVVFCYDLAEIQRLQELIEKTMKEIQDVKEQNTYLDPNSLNYTPKRVKFLTQKLLHLQKNYSRAVTSELFLSRFKGCAFVSFQFSELRDYLLESHQNNLRVFYDDTKFLKLSQAQTAEAVNWSNFKTSKFDLLKNQIVSIFVLIFLLALFLLAFVMIKQLYKNVVSLDDKNNPAGATPLTINILSGLLLTVFYNCINKTTQILANRQSNSSQNTTRISRLIKGCIFALLLLISAAIIYSQALSHRSNHTPFKIMMVLSFFLLFQTIYNMLPISHLCVVLRQWKYGSAQSVQTFQIQLNRQLHLKQFDIVEVVLFQIITIFFTSFFSHYVFFSAISLGLVLLVNYWIFKYSLIRFSSLPKRITRRLVEVFIELFEFQLIMFTAGSYFSLINNASNISQGSAQYYFSFGLSAKEFALAQLIFTVILKVLLLFWPRGIPLNQQKKQLTFTEALSLFPYHYGIESPATKFWNGEEAQTNNRLSFAYESFQQNQMMKKKSTNIDKQLFQIGSIEISKEYSTSKKRGSLAANKLKNNIK